MPLKTIAAVQLNDNNIPCHTMTLGDDNQNGMEHCEHCDDMNQCTNAAPSVALMPSQHLLSDVTLSLSLRDIVQPFTLQTLAVLLRPPRT